MSELNLAPHRASGHGATIEAVRELPTEQSTDLTTEPVIELHEATVTAARGTVFGPVSATICRPVTVVHGASGTGRTSLLLSIAGRMRLGEGTLRTLGETRLAQIRRRVGIAGFAEIDALEPAVTVGATLRERLSWSLPWYRHTPRMTDALAAELLAPAFGGEALPAHTTLVRDVDSAEQMLLRIALALIDVPEMLVIDDFDALRNPADRVRIATRLNALATDPSGGIDMVIATSDPGDISLFRSVADGQAPAVIEL